MFTAQWHDYHKQKCIACFKIARRERFESSHSKEMTVVYGHRYVKSTMFTCTEIPCGAPYIQLLCVNQK